MDECKSISHGQIALETRLCQQAVEKTVSSDLFWPCVNVGALERVLLFGKCLQSFHVPVYASVYFG